MLLTIGKVAQFFGLSSETLRVYEKNGIISPSRRSESQYREFTAWDIFDLNECVGYRGMNLSLKEIRMVTKEGTSDDLTALLEKKENELRAQVGREQELCEFIREYRERVEMAPYNLNHFWFGKEPAYKYIVSFKNKDGIYTGLETDNKVLRRWNKEQPYSRAFFHFGIGNPDMEDDEFFVSAAIREDRAVRFGLPMDESVHTLPARLVLHTVVDGREKGQLSADMLKPALAHVKESGLELDGQIVGELILRAYQGGEPHRYLNIMIPVKEKLLFTVDFLECV